MMHADLWNVINTFGSNRKYTVVGHSLGGAMAILLTLEMKSKGQFKPINALEPFEEPHYFSDSLKTQK